MNTNTVDVESQAVVVREAQAVDRALSVDEIRQRLDFIKKVMHENMAEGQDYGKIPGCGDKPGLFQPGAQKLALTFQLSPIVAREVLRELRNDHREYEFTLAITTASGRVLANGVGTCSTLESKYRYRGGSRKCPECGKESIIKGKQEYGGGWLCFQKKGGCGAKWPDGDQAIEGQSVERVEHDNAADFWNTVRKMAFKRALVHGMINATNTSELWSQDLEDIVENGHSSSPETPKSPVSAPRPAPTSSQVPKAAKTAQPGAPASLKERIVGMKIKLTERFGASGVGWAVGMLKSYSVEHSDANPALMGNEGLDDLNEGQVGYLALHWKAFEDRLAEFIKDNDQSDLAPETPVTELGKSLQAGPDDPPTVASPQGCEMITSTIDHVSIKTSETGAKKSWVLFGIKCRGEYHNSFDKKIGDFAISLKGKEATIYYAQEAKGRRVVAVTGAGKTVQSGE